MKLVAIGFDPGLTGAVAVLDDQGVELFVDDLPTVPLDTGGMIKKRIDGRELGRMLRAHVPSGVTVRAFIEQVGAMGGLGEGKNNAVQIVVSLGRSMGAIEGVLEALGVVPTTVGVQAWKAMYGIGSNKETARALARSLFPDVDMHLVAHHNRAEALLIANYGLRKLCGTR